ncbi:MAG TPA: 1-acyl-sn-glycerol-3-phosphate acyltransferase [Anaerolineae bacterium]|nr:1-acyl-sn-glycerol-3-phosphate acyltransferase [Anaerolineae bacterium]
MRLLLRLLLYLIGYPLFNIVLKIKVTGRENLPPKGEPLIVICNHFSWFEAPLLAGYLPYKIIFLAAEEVTEHPAARLLAYAFAAIPLRRGQVDRRALRQATAVLENGGVIGIFPEGGIDPDLRPLTEAGENVARIHGQTYRVDAQLIPARPGAAYLAARSGARILPVAVTGGEQVIPNLRQRRRTAVTLIIGPPFGPLSLDKTARGPERRQKIDALGHEMMRRIAALLPPEQRGCYGEVSE